MLPKKSNYVFIGTILRQPVGHMMSHMYICINAMTVLYILSLSIPNNDKMHIFNELAFPTYLVFNFHIIFGL